MVVVGGGFLGSELACALGHRGTLPHFLFSGSLSNEQLLVKMKLIILNFDNILSDMLKLSTFN